MLIRWKIKFYFDEYEFKKVPTIHKLKFARKSFGTWKIEQPLKENKKKLHQTRDWFEKFVSNKQIARLYTTKIYHWKNNKMLTWAQKIFRLHLKTMHFCKKVNKRRVVASSRVSRLSLSGCRYSLSPRYGPVVNYESCRVRPGPAVRRGPSSEDQARCGLNEWKSAKCFKTNFYRTAFYFEKETFHSNLNEFYALQCSQILLTEFTVLKVLGVLVDASLLHVPFDIPTVITGEKKKSQWQHSITSRVARSYDRRGSFVSSCGNKSAKSRVAERTLRRSVIEKRVIRPCIGHSSGGVRSSASCTHPRIAVTALFLLRIFFFRKR